MTDHRRWMQLALSLGRRGMGRVAPNPAVGCVIVKQGRIVGRGWTQAGGRPHAETVALAEVGEAARGATAYVTLEPCSHQGVTPPCADALIRAGIARVVTPMEDPDAHVSGRGHERLREAGIEVISDICEEQAAEDHRGFILNRTIGRPFVTLKLATSLDGRIATETGESRWITGPEARAEVHLMRARHDAVMIGAGTARADDPMLDIRGLGLEAANPIRIVVDGGLSLSFSSKLAKTADQQPLWICHRHGIDRDRLHGWKSTDVDLIEVEAQDGMLSLPDMMAKLAERGITRILCEGGSQMAAGLLRDELVDELVLFTAGLALGEDGVPSLAGLGFEALAEHPRLELVECRRVGGDVLSRWKT